MNLLYLTILLSENFYSMATDSPQTDCLWVL